SSPVGRSLDSMPARLVALVAGLLLLAGCGARPSLGAPAATSPTTLTTAGASTVTTAGTPTDPATTTAASVTLPVPSTPATPAAPPPPPPSPPPAAVAGGLYLLGDSVMLGARDALEHQFPGAVVDAVESRSFVSGIDVVRRLDANGTLAANVVVHLGANGAVSEGECDQMMDALAGHHVVLLTVKVPRSWEAPNNAVIRDCAARRGAALADWQSVALANPAALYKDGTHLRPPGGGLLYTNLIQQHL